MTTLSKSERKQARREMAADAAAAPRGEGFAALSGVAAPASGAWLARERAWESEERRANQRISYMAAPLFALPILLVQGVINDPMSYTPGQSTAAQIARVTLAVALAAMLLYARRAVHNPLLDVWERRRHEVVWVYERSIKTVSTGAGGSVSDTRQHAVLALADGSSASTQTPLQPGEFMEIAASFPAAAKGYSDARRDAFKADPRSVR